MLKEWNTPGGTAPRLYLDILQQPHTLIAGTTGSGKSVVMNGILYTALYNFPHRVKFVLIDLKRVELRMYKDLPHTLEYCNTASAAILALNRSIEYMEQEYARMEEAGKRKSDAADRYIIIDELHDLIYQAPEAVQLLAKIARLGRAANVHIIAATQTPNRKTLSADFAANCPARLGLRCRDKIESRQIIGDSCAVDLPIYGQAYYIAPQYSEPQLFKIPYYTDEELAERVKWWIDQIPPEPKHGIIYRTVYNALVKLDKWLISVNEQTAKPRK